MKTELKVNDRLSRNEVIYKVEKRKYFVINCFNSYI